MTTTKWPVSLKIMIIKINYYNKVDFNSLF